MNTGIYLKPVVDVNGESHFFIMTSGTRHPVIVLTRSELEQLISDAAVAMGSADVMSAAVKDE